MLARDGTLLLEVRPGRLPLAPSAARARRTAVAAATGVVAAAGLVHAWLTPRGPLSAGAFVGWTVAMLAVGVVAGIGHRSRWSLLLAPATFVAMVELGRIPLEGPTVDAVDLGTTFGVLAFIVGRGVHGLLVLLPLELGVLAGLAAGRRLAGDTAGRGRMAGRAVTGLLTLGLLALVVTVARPASTAPILGLDGNPLPGSIAELATVTIGGHEQSLLIRGRDVTDPVLLHLAGGPGGTDIGAMRDDVSLEEHVVVATWDQRGTGRSYAALDPVSTLTVEQMVADTIEVATYLRDRFGHERILLTGNSWGSILGVLAVQQRPDLFHAYIGTGQMVDVAETDRMFHEDTLAWAADEGDEALVRTLRELGPPPYRDPADYLPIVSYEHHWNAYPGVDDLNEMPFNTFVPENTLLDRVNAARGLVDTYAALYPQLEELDLRRSATRLEVPVYLVMGRHEARGRQVPADEWFAQLDAPAKERVEFAASGHRPSFEEPAAFAQLVDRIIDQTHARD